MSLPDFLETAGYRRIPLSRNGVGHFEASGTLVGRAVRVLIDTGAASTVVSLGVDVFEMQAAVIEYGSGSLFPKDA